MRYSKHFSFFAIRGLVKAGQLYCPGDKTFPSFSQANCVYEIDRVADYMTPADRNGLKILLTIFYFLPKFLLRALLNKTEFFESAPKFIQPLLRQIQIGVKGVVMSLYYSDVGHSGDIHRKIGWNAHMSNDFAPAPKGVPLDVHSAFEKVRSGQAFLRKLSIADRLTALKRLRHAIYVRHDEIISRLQNENGKSATDALVSELLSVVDHFDYLEKFARKVLSTRKAHTPLMLMGKKSKVYFEPMGTVLVISPWNYPFYQSIVPITLALVCGNTVVYKPSEFTPLKGLIESLLEDAEIPSNWVQIIYGDGSVGVAAIECQPQKIFFTGSARTGRAIMGQAAKYLIPVELELGGKDPMIVFDDVNVERAVSAALWGALTNSGQSCTSIERIYVQESIYEDFLSRMVARAKQLKVGNHNDVTGDMGSMTTDAQVAVVREHLEDALNKGARLHTGASWDRHSRIIPPLVIDGVNSSMKIYSEESFGPFVMLAPFKTEQDAIKLANDSEFGLAAAVFSNDKLRGERVARALQCGNVSINNVMLTEGNHALPFGGTKNSGFGRYKGEFGFYSFSNIKSVIVDNDSKKIEANWYPYSMTKYELFKRLLKVAYVKKGFTFFFQFIVAGIGLESQSQKDWKNFT